MPGLEELLQLTKKLITVPSIVGTEGEARLAQLIYDHLASQPYFRKHPGYLQLRQTVNDDCERYNVLALVKGEGEPGAKTVILMSHMDTAGIEDYGDLAPWACNPDELAQRLRQRPDLPPGVAESLASGSYLFGRGALDMKSGLAVHLGLIQEFAENVGQMSGNVLLVAACDEEDMSHGMLSALKELKRLAETEGLEYIAALNADCTCPCGLGDRNRYIHMGSIGKLLPTFFVAGRETHAGQPFQGFDPNLLAAELVRLIDCNSSLCDRDGTEVTAPPVSLKLSDLKRTYTVQTTLAAYCYFNVFLYRRTTEQVMNLMKKQAVRAFDRVLDRLNRQYRAYCRKTGQVFQQLPWRPRVYTYAELYRELCQKYGEPFSRAIETYARELRADRSLDLRTFSLQVVREVWKWVPDQSPAVVVFFSSLYSPWVKVDERSIAGRRLVEAVRQGITAAQTLTGYPIVTRPYFPYISDMSFLSLGDSDSGIRCVEENTPAWGVKHKVDFSDIAAINVPVVNIGTYGSDPHKKWERVDIDYTLGVLPVLTRTVVNRLLQG